jgi:hypothetical protein
VSGHAGRQTRPAVKTWLLGGARDVREILESEVLAGGGTATGGLVGGWPRKKKLLGVVLQTWYTFCTPWYKIEV